MTPGVIRAAAIDRIARARFASIEARWIDYRTPAERREVADHCRALAVEAVDALGALMPTAVERLAAYAVMDTSDEGLVQRYVTDWMAVDV